MSIERLKEMRDGLSLTIASYRTRQTPKGWECNLTCGRPGNSPRWLGNGATKEGAIDSAAGHAVSYWESVGLALPGGGFAIARQKAPTIGSEMGSE